MRPKHSHTFGDSRRENFPKISGAAKIFVQNHASEIRDAAEISAAGPRHASPTPAPGRTGPHKSCRAPASLRLPRHAKCGTVFDAFRAESFRKFSGAAKLFVQYHARWRRNQSCRTTPRLANTRTRHDDKFFVKCTARSSIVSAIVSLLGSAPALIAHQQRLGARRTRVVDQNARHGATGVTINLNTF